MKSREKEIAKINWQQLEAKDSKKKRVGDIYLTVSKRKDGRDTCYISILDPVMDKMEWKTGDKISVFYDPNDQFHWLIAKTSIGYTLAKANGLHRLGFISSLNLDSIDKNEEIEYKTFKDKITFKLKLKENLE